MKVFVGGVATAVLGLLGIIIWHHAVFKIILSVTPLILLLGGLMAAYLGYDEAKDKLPCCKAGETRNPQTMQNWQRKPKDTNRKPKDSKANWTRLKPKPAKKPARIK